MSGDVILRDDARLSVFDSRGAGLPVVFQHGLTGDEAQVRQNFPDGPVFRRLTLECRAHGGSAPGSARPFSIACFAEDVLAAADAAGLGRFVAGGISMGAAIALYLAARHPARVAALILVRPAWAFAPAPADMRPFVEVARLLRTRPPAEAKRAFVDSATAAMLAERGPDNLASLLGLFDRPDPAVTADLIESIAEDGTGVSESRAAELALPTLVIGNALDHVHPLKLAEKLAGVIPDATLVEVPAKARDKERHGAEVRAEIRRFLTELSSRQRVFPP